MNASSVIEAFFGVSVADGVACDTRPFFEDYVDFKVLVTTEVRESFFLGDCFESISSTSGDESGDLYSSTKIPVLGDCPKNQ